MFSKSERSEATAAPAERPNIRIGDLLVEQGLITPEQINQALAYQRERGHRKLLGEVVVELKFVTEEQVLACLAEAFGVPFGHISPRVADPRVVEMLPREFLEKQTVLPLFHVQGKLTVAVHEPSNVFLVEEIQRLAGCPVQLVAATAHDIRSTLEAHLPSANVFVIDDIVEDIGENALSLVEQQVTDLSNLEEAAGDSPVIKLVNYVLFTAVQEGASDIHIEPGDKQLRVRYRVDGQLYEKLRPPFQMTPAVVSRVKIMAGLDISERRMPQDGGITVMLSKHPVDLRVSTMPTKFGEKVVMRIVDNRSATTTLDQLGFASDTLRLWRSLIEQPNGVVLVTGPTGSGKSTTLYASLNAIVNDAVNISTVEDPVENNLSQINQFQVNEKAGFTFATALRALLRQDPDIMMVGEVRDAETAKIAVQAALTGHLVLSTLHTNDAPSAVTRLFNIGVDPYLVAASVRGVLAQRLLRKICKHCREQAPADAAIHRQLAGYAGSETIDTVHRGTGCPKCRGTGYRGRVGVYELYVPDDEALDAISRGATLQEIRRIARASGLRTLQDDGLDKVRSGVTSVEELLRATAVM